VNSADNAASNAKEADEAVEEGRLLFAQECGFVTGAFGYFRGQLFLVAITGIGC